MREQNGEKRKQIVLFMWQYTSGGEVVMCKAGESGVRWKREESKLTSSTSSNRTK